MNSIILANFGPVSNRFANLPANDDLSSGIQSSYGLVGYKGKVWSIRYRGDETQIMRDDGDGPRSSIEVVIIKAAPVVSKVFYEDGYVEGSTAPPDCFSNNGVTPDATSVKKQCDTCAMCPKNQWGSRITPAGKSGKACADSKRLAVVPLVDLQNEAYGGPLLLRVPAASLQDLAMYGQKMNQLGYPYYAIATRIQFDSTESYPKFVFNGIRPLTDDEADIVLQHQDGHTVHRILSENEFSSTPQIVAPDEAASAFEQPPEQPAEKKAATVGAQVKAAAAATKANATAANPAAKPAAKKAPPPVEEVTTEVTAEESDEDREMRELEAKMAAMKAKKAAEAKAAAEAEKQAAKAAAAAEVVEEDAEVVDESGGLNAASEFEAELDSMLDGLLN